VVKAKKPTAGTAVGLIKFVKFKTRLPRWLAARSQAAGSSGNSRS